MAVRIGINPLTWTNDDMPELGADTPLETCLSEARAAGYEGVELGYKFPRTADELRPRLERHGLSLISGWYGSRLLERSAAAEIKAMSDHLTLLTAMGCRIMVFAEVTGSVHGEPAEPISKRPILDEGDWTSFAERLTEVAEHLDAHGIRMAYHHHMGTVIQTEDDTDRLMDRTGEAVGLLVDTGHLTYAGADPVKVIERHGARINHVHCKDVRREVLSRALAQDWSFLDAVLAGVFTVPGDGAVDFPAALRALAAGGYEGWLVVEAEQDPAKAHPLTYARMGRDAIGHDVAVSGL